MTETISIPAPHGWGVELDLRGLGCEYDLLSVRGASRDDAIAAAIGYLRDAELAGSVKIGIGPVELIQEAGARIGDADYLLEWLEQRATDDGWIGLEEGESPSLKDLPSATADLHRVIDGWLARHLETEIWRVAVRERGAISADLDGVEFLEDVVFEVQTCPANCAHLRRVGETGCVLTCAEEAACGSDECRRLRVPAERTVPA